MHKIYPLLQNTNFPPLTRKALQTVQVNLGYKCNQRCLHCHVNAGPNRKEMMNRETVDAVIDFVIKNKINTVDLTGGAPELNENFRYIIQKLKKSHVKIIDRCNLTVLHEKGMEDLADFLASHGVQIIASLPCYEKDNVDRQRGKDVFNKSISALKILNKLGYGQTKNLLLNLVYNPQNDSLPPNQFNLENEYKRRLYKEHKIVFNNLYTITNMPISRFGSQLVSSKKFVNYMQLLKDSFSINAHSRVMCKSLISIDYNGYVYDCDFNQLLGIPLSNEKKHISELNISNLSQKQIAIADHCYGCTAGSGSSCGGTLTK